MADFSRNLAFIIGINNYTNGISPLQNAENDAKKLVELLREKHGYKVWVCLNELANLNTLNKLLEKILPKQVCENDRLLFYFAGHGIALHGDDGPAGYLIPQDAKLNAIETYLPMAKLQASLEKLTCRHFLGILDCCFAGAFHWSSTRDLLTAPEVIHKERYDRFITDPAWQVITSAAYDQKALDAFNFNTERGQRGNHSPFAAALIDALAGKADVYPPSINSQPPGDGVITATELYLYLRDAVEPATEEHRQRQTPGIHPLKKHNKGEYIFLSPGHPLNLPPAPPLDVSKNPYRGLESFDEEHTELFFGRTQLVEKLENFVKTHPLTVVLGASGSGKSSLVKAGLIPQLRIKKNDKWCILPPIRPGETPLQGLNNVLRDAQLPEVKPQNPQQNLAMSIDVWAKRHPNSQLLLFIDQSEEIITLCQNEDEHKEFFQQIIKAINAHPHQLRVVLSLRSDFEPQVRDAGLKFVPTVLKLGNTVLKNNWQSGRFIVPAMTRGKLREAIESPASTRVMHFQPHQLVEQLIDEVADMPGALPLLSFALSELYLKYLQRQREAENRGITIDRALTQADYQELGGVMQSLTQRADEEYQALVEENPAYDQVIRHVMLRMVALTGGELARRRVPLSELEYPPQKNDLVQEVIERFTKVRLLVKGEDAQGNPYVEPAHDALVRGWQKLLEWKQEDEESLLLQRRLTPAAQEWKSQQQAKFLWNANPRLDLLEKVSKSDNNWLNKVEAEFVRRSIRQKSFNTRRNWGVAIAVMLGLGTGLVFSLIGQRNAMIGEIKASRQAAEANLELGLYLEAWVNSLRGAKSLKDWPGYLFLFKPDPKLKIQVKKTLHKVAYGVRERNRLEKHQGRVIGLAISSNGNRIASVDNTGLICLWDRSGKLLNDDCFQGPKGWVQSASFNSDVNSLATITGSTNSDGSIGPDSIFTLGLWDLETQQQVELNQDRRGWAWNVSFSKDGEQLATKGAYADSTVVRYWDLSGQEISKNQFKGEPKFSMPLTLRSSNGNVATAEGDKFSLKDSYGQEIAQINTNHGWIDSWVFSPDGQQLITAGRDGIIRIWDFQATQFPDRSDNSQVPWSSIDGVGLLKSQDTTLFSGCHSGIIDQVIASPDNKLRATSARDGTVCLWDSDYKELAKFKGYANGAMIASFSPDSKLLATAGLDGIAKLWDVKSKEQIAEFNARKRGQVFNLNFSPDGKQLAMFPNDRILRLWKIESLDELVVRGCNWVRDYLENNPNVEASDRHLCDDVLKVVVQDSDRTRS